DDLVRRQADDIRLLVRSNKALRRELTGLRVRRWRDDEAIRALEGDLGETRTALDGARRRNQLLAQEMAALSSHRWRILPRRGARRATEGGEGGLRSVLEGDGPF